MQGGLIQQVDAPQKLYDYPANIFVAGFIGTPRMNFFDAVLTGTKNKVYVEFEGTKILLPKTKSASIINLEEYLNTGKPIVLGVRPEDFHDEELFISNSKDTCIEVKVDAVEKLGAETLLYCIFDDGAEEVLEEGQIKSLVETKTPMIAKVDSRSTTEADQKVVLGIDILHAHLFDKETELSILEGEGTKAYVPTVELERIANGTQDELINKNRTFFEKLKYAKQDKAKAKAAKAAKEAEEAAVVEEVAEGDNVVEEPTVEE